MSLIANKNLLNYAHLEKAAKASLVRRIQSSEAYNEDEILEISKLDRSLFPKDFEISDSTRETLRVLCSYSRCELKKATDIRSHRPFIGPLIVFFKRLSWPLIRFHLRETFESLQLFQTRMVYSYAKQAVHIEKLERALKKN